MTIRNNPFTPAFSDLPEQLPIFPLPGIAVMPGTQLPLNIFEPRYLRMVFDVLATHRMIGMVQPEPESGDDHTPPVYRTGTAGRITSFSETKDGRLMILLTGICRFQIREELADERPYRSVIADWSRFSSDYEESEESIPDRTALFSALRAYCDKNQVDIAWKQAEELEDQALIDLLMVHLPLGVQEKQALIECIGLNDRTRLLQGLLDMSNAHEGGSTAMRH
jgi:Lon protease-like protein